VAKLNPYIYRPLEHCCTNHLADSIAHSDLTRVPIAFGVGAHSMMLPFSDLSRGPANSLAAAEDGGDPSSPHNGQLGSHTLNQQATAVGARGSTQTGGTGSTSLLQPISCSWDE
jgi:hypothetical protein